MTALENNATTVVQSPGRDIIFYQPADTDRADTSSSNTPVVPYRRLALGTAVGTVRR